MPRKTPARPQSAPIQNLGPDLPPPVTDDARCEECGSSIDVAPPVPQPLVPLTNVFACSKCGKPSRDRNRLCWDCTTAWRRRGVQEPSWDGQPIDTAAIGKDGGITHFDRATSWRYSVGIREEIPNWKHSEWPDRQFFACTVYGDSRGRWFAVGNTAPLKGDYQKLVGQGKGQDKCVEIDPSDAARLIKDAGMERPEALEAVVREHMGSNGTHPAPATDFTTKQYVASDTRETRAKKARPSAIHRALVELLSRSKTGEDISKRAIARAVGCTAQHLYRSIEFKSAHDLQVKSRRDRVPRGTKGKDGRIEAHWDDK